MDGTGKEETMKSLFLAAIALAAIGALMGCSPEPPAVPNNPPADLRTLTKEDSADFKRMAGQMKEATGTQLDVLVVENLGRRSIEQYAASVTKHWAIGERDRIVLVLAVKARAFRVEYGPDAPEKSVEYFRRILANFVGWLQGVACYHDELGTTCRG